MGIKILLITLFFSSNYIVFSQEVKSNKLIIPEYGEVIAAELFVELECGFMAAEVEQAVEGAFNVPGIGAAGAQDGFDDWGVFPHRLLIECSEAPGQSADGFEHVGVVLVRDEAPVALVPVVEHAMRWEVPLAAGARPLEHPGVLDRAVGVEPVRPYAKQDCAPWVDRADQVGEPVHIIRARHLIGFETGDVEAARS